jgi:hypothetical protein
MNTDGKTSDSRMARPVASLLMGRSARSLTAEVRPQERQLSGAQSGKADDGNGSGTRTPLT